MKRGFIDVDKDERKNNDCALERFSLNFSKYTKFLSGLRIFVIVDILLDNNEK